MDYLNQNYHGRTPRTGREAFRNYADPMEDIRQFERDARRTAALLYACAAGAAVSVVVFLAWTLAA